MVKHKKNQAVLPAELTSATNHSIYSQLFSKLNDLVLVLSLDSHIEYANPAAESFFKLKRQNYTGHSIDRYLTYDLLLKFLDAAKRVRHYVSPFRIEIDLHALDRNTTMMELTVSPRIEGKTVTGFYLNIRDFSHERQVQELVRESQKMEALQYFVSGTTKEIQHPLLAILKKIEGFEKKYVGRSFEYVSFKEFTQIMDFLKGIHGQIENCYKTTAKLTNLNKKHLKFESQYCSATDVIREIVKLKDANLQSERVKFRLRLSDKLPLISLGEIELTEIMNHIIDNALQAMPAGGQLTVASALTNGGHEVRIDISDDGVGIAPEDLAHIFEPFFTTKQRGAQHSTGLGLAIVYSLVKAAHGQIKVESSLRKGTTVHLTFPVAEQLSRHDYPQKPKRK